LEFKSPILWDNKNQRCAKDKFLQLKVVFSIAAFMIPKEELFLLESILIRLLWAYKMILDA
jgi:hypothetical protein